MGIAWRRHADGSLSGQVGRYVQLSVKREKAPGGSGEVWAPYFHMALHVPTPGQYDTPEQACRALEEHVREALRDTFRAARETWPRKEEV